MNFQVLSPIGLPDRIALVGELVGEAEVLGFQRLLELGAIAFLEGNPRKVVAGKTHPATTRSLQSSKDSPRRSE